MRKEKYSAIAVALMEQFIFEHEPVHINLSVLMLISAAPPPAGHLASLTHALICPTFLVLYTRKKKEESHWPNLKVTQVTKTLRM